MGALPDRVGVRTGLVGATAAAAFVIAGAVMAPRRRIVVALFLYAVGAYVAWWNLRSWYVPEGHPRAYQPSEVPLVLTLIGGMVGLLAVAGWQLRDGVGRRRVGGARAA